MVLDYFKIKRRIQSMSRRSILIACFAALCLPGMCLAQAAAPQAPAQPATQTVVATPVKVAWLNLELAVFNCEEGKREFGEVQKFVEKKNADLEAMRKESDTLKNQLNVQGSKLTDEARADLEEQIETKDTNLQRFQQDTQKQIDSLRVRVTNMVGRKMLPIIEKLSKDKGLHAVVYINPSRDAYVDPSLIITDEVIKAYNQAYPLTAAKPATTAAPAKKP
jgi:Skp family chaperone for outer membrane proteins